MIRINQFIKHFFSFKNIIGIFISILCIYWSFTTFEVDKFFNHIKSINYYLFISAVMLLVISVLIRSFRWLLFFSSKEMKELKIILLFKNEMIGYFGNNIFPLRLGDLLRVSKMSSNTKMPQAYLLGTIIAERIIDILSLIIFLLLFLIFSWNNQIILGFFSEFNFVNIVDLSIYLLLLVLVVLIVYFCTKNNKLFDWSLFALAFLNIKGSKKIFKILLFSLSIWMIYLINIIIISYSMPGIKDFSIIEAMIILIFVTLSIVVVPSAPGAIGTFQAAVIFIMTSSLFGYEKSEAISFSIILHSYSYITYSIIGGYFFIKSNLKVDS